MSRPNTRSDQGVACGFPAGRDRVPTFDLTVFNKLVASEDSNFIARVIEIFLGSSECLVRDASDALKAGDNERMSQAAHTLKSSSAQMGGMRLHALVVELELALHEGHENRIPRILSDIEREYAELRNALNVLLSDIRDDKEEPPLIQQS